MTTRALVAGLAALLALGCGGNEAGSCPTECPPCQTCFYGACVPDPGCTDAGVEGDAEPETPEGADGTPDAPPDLPPEITPDAPPDLPPEVTPDAPPDLPPEITPDGPPDFPPEIVPDVTPEVRPDVTPETEVRPEADARPDVDVVTGRNTGDPCTSSTECRGPGADCVTVLPHPLGAGTWTWPGGYCSSDCDPDGACGPGGYCADGSFIGLPRMCVKSCTSASDCRSAEGYICSGFYLFDPFCGPSL